MDILKKKRSELKSWWTDHVEIRLDLVGFRKHILCKRSSGNILLFLQECYFDFFQNWESLEANLLLAFIPYVIFPLNRGYKPPLYCKQTLNQQNQLQSKLKKKSKLLIIYRKHFHSSSNISFNLVVECRFYCFNR